MMIQLGVTKGFTIVELLVVIVVIGILAAITIVAYTGVQDRARALAVTTGIKNVEEAFRLLGTETPGSKWPGDTAFTSSNNPSIQQIISSGSNFKSYLPIVPVTPGLSTTWTYDNDGDTRTVECGGHWQAVSLALTGVPDPIMQHVDDALDDGNLGCGDLQKSGATMLYQLSRTQDM